jgi:hypothetical protein
MPVSSDGSQKCDSAIFTRGVGGGERKWFNPQRAMIPGETR